MVDTVTPIFWQHRKATAGISPLVARDIPKLTGARPCLPRTGRSLLAGCALLMTTPVAALLLVISVLGLPIGLALGALYAIALFGGVLVTALFLGDAEARLFKTGPIVTRGQHVLRLLAGVVTLALLRSLLGGLVVFASLVFGLGALMLAAYQAYSHVSSPASA